MKEKGFQKTIDCIGFKDFCDLYCNRKKYLEDSLATLNQSSADQKSNMNDPEFEYPIIFLELVDYLSGSRIHYPQELFANKLEKIENETNALEQSDLDSDDLSPDYHY